MARLARALGFGAVGLAAAGVAGGIFASVFQAAERAGAERADAAAARAVASVLATDYDLHVEAIVAGRELVAAGDGALRREVRGAILQNGQSKPFFAVGSMTCPERQPADPSACWRLDALFLDGESVALGDAAPSRRALVAATQPLGDFEAAAAGAQDLSAQDLAAEQLSADEPTPQKVLASAEIDRSALEQPALSQPALNQSEIAQVAPEQPLAEQPTPDLAQTELSAAPAPEPDADQLVEAAAQLLTSADGAGRPAVAALSGEVGRALFEAGGAPEPTISAVDGPATHAIGGSEVNLRAGPDTTFASLGLVRRGLRLRLLETVGAWGRFQVVDETPTAVARGQEVWVYLPLTAPI